MGKVDENASNEERFKILDDDAKVAENKAAVEQSEATAAGNAEVSAEQDSTAAKQAANAALETAKKLQSEAAAEKLKLEGKEEEAARALQPLQDEFSKARDAAI